MGSVVRASASLAGPLLSLAVVAAGIATVLPVRKATAATTYAIELALAHGAPAPSEPGATFTSFALLDYAADGSLYFWGTTGGASGALFRLAGPSLEVLRRRGDPAPAAVGGTYRSLVSSAVAPDGELAFECDLDGGSVGRGVFRYGAAGDVALALAGDDAPGTGGGHFVNFLDVAVGSSGRVVFVAAVTGGSSSLGVFRVDGTQVTAVALSGQAAPVGGPYGEFLHPVVSDAGAIAFVATDANDDAGQRVVRVTGGVHEVVARQGDPAPGFPGLQLYGGAASTQFPAFHGLSIGTDGELGFAAALETCWLTVTLGVVVPNPCAGYSALGASLVHRGGGADTAPVGSLYGTDVESGLGVLLHFANPTGVVRVTGSQVTDVAVGGSGLSVLTSRIGPGGEVMLNAHPTGSSGPDSLYRAVPSSSVSALGPLAMGGLAGTLAIGGLAQLARASAASSTRRGSGGRSPAPIRSTKLSK